ncbi:uncharacterized protein [Hoplias malabaricus]|uniref:uncharacterized protein isoform X3 n=1 Tax=Hoplias malabaricus TaxID=27720 RepID=UPI003462DB1D
MLGLFYLTFLVTTQGVTGSFIAQLESTVLVQSGLSISLVCHVLLDGHFNIFWIKNPPNKPPVCVATAKAFVDEVAMCKHFENHSRIKAKWNQMTFNLSFSSVEQTDAAIYFCGSYNYGQYFFGNGTTLMLEKHADTVSSNATSNDKNNGKKQVFEYLAASLAATNTVSIFIIVLLCCHLRRKNSGVASEAESVDIKCDEVNYAALSFDHKHRRTVQTRTKLDTMVLYGAVKNQEEL